MNNQIEYKKYVREGFFTLNEERLVNDFIKSVNHRPEFRQLIMHVYNFRDNPESGLAPLLRMVNIFNIEGLVLLLKSFSYGAGIDDILTDEYFLHIKMQHELKNIIF